MKQIISYNSYTFTNRCWNKGRAPRKCTGTNSYNTIWYSELKNLQTEERELSGEIVKLKDPDYIAKYARENYLYSMEGEYVIKIEDKKEEIKESDNADDKIYYIMGITISILIVLLIAVIIKIVKNKKSK